MGCHHQTAQTFITEREMIAFIGLGWWHMLWLSLVNFIGQKYWPIKLPDNLLTDRWQLSANFVLADHAIGQYFISHDQFLLADYINKVLVQSQFSIYFVIRQSGRKNRTCSILADKIGQRTLTNYVMPHERLLATDIERFLSADRDR